jgi:hypothetical protein
VIADETGDDALDDRAAAHIVVEGVGMEIGERLALMEGIVARRCVIGSNGR